MIEPMRDLESRLQSLDLPTHPRGEMEAAAATAATGLVGRVYSSFGRTEPESEPPGLIQESHMLREDANDKETFA